ncbi:glutaredoxin-like protein, putative [Bodo saltans]|uniref:Glutaredoxin-like protein, putative n=1 Tax=Bodo saltans TaxID=75058 RepID=A0A0S4JPM6_BODSA|nr:glutaredoxin-like protein, putative [Bodo saltans]|eukprot:CUG91327.1 glutaredoxin-like protein, putative [Bodo saltans]
MRRVLSRHCALLSSAAATCRPSTFASQLRCSSNSSGFIPPTAPPLGGDVNKDADTHPDFQPRIVSSSSVDSSYDEIEAIKKDIRDTIKDEEVVLFMKGLPEAPVCGFSKKLVDVLEALGLEYTSFDVLAHPVVRTYVKELSDWPTIPQLWVKNEFVGGVDICLKMAESGELQGVLDKHHIKHRNKI